MGMVNYIMYSMQFVGALRLVENVDISDFVKSMWELNRTLGKEEILIALVNKKTIPKLNHICKGKFIYWVENDENIKDDLVEFYVCEL